MSVVFVSPTPGLEQIAPAPMPVNAVPPSTWVSAEQLQAWIRLEAAQAAYAAVKEQINSYINNTFTTWYSSYSGGHLAGPTGVVGDPDAVPPQPPTGAMAQLNATGLAFDLVQTGPPVCAIPPYTKIPAPGTGHVSGLSNVTGPTGLVNPFSSATAVGQVIVAGDGTQWVRIL